MMCLLCRTNVEDKKLFCCCGCCYAVVDLGRDDLVVVWKMGELEAKLGVLVLLFVCCYAVRRLRDGFGGVI